MKDKSESFKIIRERDQSIQMQKLLLIENKDYELLSKLFTSMVIGPIYYISIGVLIALSLFNEWYFIRQFSLLFMAIFIAFFGVMLLIEHDGKKLYPDAEVFFMTPHKRRAIEKKYTITKIEGLELTIWLIVFVGGLIPFIIGLGIVDGSWGTAVLFGLFAILRFSYDILDEKLHPNQISFSKSYYPKYKLLLQ